MWRCTTGFFECQARHEHQKCLSLFERLAILIAVFVFSFLMMERRTNEIPKRPLLTVPSPRLVSMCLDCVFVVHNITHNVCVVAFEAESKWFPLCARLHFLIAWSILRRHQGTWIETSNWQAVLCRLLAESMATLYNSLEEARPDRVVLSNRLQIWFLKVSLLLKFFASTGFCLHLAA